MNKKVDYEVKTSKFIFDSFIVWMFILCTLWTLRPFFSWSTYMHGIFSGLSTPFFILGLVAYFLQLMICGVRFDNKTVILVITTFIVSFLMIGVCGGFKFEKLLSGSWIPYMVIMTYLLLPNKLKKEIYNKLTLILAVMLIPSIIIYLFNLIGINLPYRTIEAFEDIKIISGVFYKHYPFAVQTGSVHAVYDAAYALRLNGIFNEAGALGTICALVLTAEKFDLKKWKNRILFIAGVLSLSLAFFLITFLFYILDNLFERKFKNVLKLIMIVVAYFIFMNVPINAEPFTSIQSRLRFTTEGLAGDNRTSEAYNSLYEEFKNEGEVTRLFGKGDGAIAEEQNLRMIDGSSYKNIIFDFGYIGFGITITWTVLVSIVLMKQNRIPMKYTMIFCTIYLINMYQRPSVFYPGYLIIFLGGFYAFNNSGINYTKIDNEV
ncbi:hypothetical protein [Clostridium thermarum]|uniref:hypothetical protein n=1 Tax=Clostridium thermarum TaxID=1716543 RepID=UPI0013D884EE|nr:hypothetical protein [Clostridium thermarum]